MSLGWLFFFFSFFFFVWGGGGISDCIERKENHTKAQGTLVLGD
jgi:hypothetical protein